MKLTEIGNMYIHNMCDCKILCYLLMYVHINMYMEKHYSSPSLFLSVRSSYICNIP